MKRSKRKFQEKREEEISANPLKPMTSKQQTYMELLQDCTVIVATGHAGTSKTYIPTVMASDLFRLGQIDNIIFCRPAVSNSKSLGFFGGTVVEKMEQWLSPVIRILKERIGLGALEIALKHGEIVYQPLETIKGSSFNNSWIIVDEAEDLTWDEVKKVITRIGSNSKLILAGDITQSDLKEDSGLAMLMKFAKKANLGDEYGFVDFDDVNDIVRSKAVRNFIIALKREE